MDIKDVNNRLERVIIEEGLLDDIKQDLNNSQTIKNIKNNIKTGADKAAGLLNKAAEKINTIIPSKEPLTYVYRANGDITFDLEKREQEIDGYYLTQYEILGEDAEQPLYDVEQDVVEKATEDLKEQSKDLVDYLEDDLKKVVLEIAFNKMDTDDNENTFDYSFIIRTKKELTDKQLEDLKSWLDGQMSDGLGEGFEQHSFPSDRYFEDVIYIENPDRIDWEEEHQNDEDDDYNDSDIPDAQIQLKLDDTLDINVYFHLWDSNNFNSSLKLQ